MATMLEERDALRAEAADLLAKKGDALTEADGARIAEIHDRVTALNAKMGEAREHEAALEAFLGSGQIKPAAKASTLGGEFVTAIKSAGKTSAAMLGDAGFVYTKADGDAPEGAIVRDETALAGFGYVAGESRFPAVPVSGVADLFNQVTIGAAGYEFLRWTFTGEPSTIADGGLKPQLTGSYTRHTVNVEEIGAHVIVSEAMLDDEAALEAKINDQLVRRVAKVEEAQILNGDGTRPNLPGILNDADIETITTAPADIIDAILEAVVKIQTGTGEEEFIADALVMNPTDWFNLRVLKDQAGQYLMGGPAFGPYGNGALQLAPNPWGLKYLVRSAAIPAGTALVGAFKEGATVYRRKGITLKATDSHAETFTHDLVTLRAFERVGFGVDYPQAFVKLAISGGSGN